jgi:RNA polymerase sigma-70 factor (ECF subfamily)
MDGATGSHTFESLLGEYRDRVFRLACSLLGNEASAEDATQEIFLKIWKALPGFRGQSAVSTWIYAIARNTCLTRRRMEGAHRTLSLDEARAAEIPARQSAAGSDAGVRALIDRLPPRYRSVLVLYYLEDRSYQQVALALDLPMGTVKTFLHRAKKDLALLLGACAPKEEVPS